MKTFLGVSEASVAVDNSVQDVSSLDGEQRAGPTTKPPSHTAQLWTLGSGPRQSASVILRPRPQVRMTLVIGAHLLVGGGAGVLHRAVGAAATQ